MTDAARDVDRGEQLRVGEVDLWVDVAGGGHDTVVLLAGADTPGFHWSPSFVDALGGTAFRVVRFDHRDCGRSSWLGSEAGYLLDDLAAGKEIEYGNMTGRIGSAPEGGPQALKDFDPTVNAGKKLPDYSVAAE